MLSFNGVGRCASMGVTAFPTTYAQNPHGWYFRMDQEREDVRISLVFLPLIQTIPFKPLIVLAWNFLPHSGVFYWCGSDESISLIAFCNGFAECLGCLAVRRPVLALEISRSWEDSWGWRAPHACAVSAGFAVVMAAEGSAVLNDLTG